ncbi:MAG: hypothetical protein HDR92_03625 [Bacteroides sp.]|nr:hypothetical protein [Bacteroides sp.]
MSDINDTQQAETKSARKHGLWRVVKWLLIIVAVLVVLVCCAVGVVVSYLEPGRLTPLVTNYASEYLNADVAASRVELSFWSTFPRVGVKIDSLRINSRAITGISAEDEAALPNDARRLLDVAHFSGSVNVALLSSGKLHFHNVIAESPDINLVKVTDSVANYLIIPDTGPDDEDQFAITEVSIDRFALTGNPRLRYLSLPDTTDISGRIVTTLTRNGSEGPLYSVELTGNVGGDLPAGMLLPETTFGLNGCVGWDISNPGAVTVKKLLVNIDKVAAEIDAEMEFVDNVFHVRALRIQADDLHVSDVIDVIPRKYRGELEKLATDLKLDVTAELLQPFRPGIDSIPSAKIELKADGSLEYDRLRLREIKADVTLNIDGNDPDLSVVDIRQFKVVGRAAGFSVDGNVTYPFTDPVVKGRFRGGLDLSLLPERLMERVKADFSGLITGNARFGFRLSDLVTSGFHHVKIDGDMRLKDFLVHKRDSNLAIFATSTVLKFGTSSSLALPAGTVDSLLVVSVLSDTMSVRFDHGKSFVTARNVRAGIGSKNISTSADTTIVNPIGGRITASQVILHSHHDTITLRMRDMLAMATIKQYKHHAHVPELSVKLEAPALRYTDPVNRATLQKNHIDFSLHLRVPDSLAAARRAHRRDSLKALRANLDTDSLRLAAQSRRDERIARDSAAIASGQAIYLDVDRSFVRWFNSHEVTGHVEAARGRFMSRHYPLGFSMQGLGVRVTTDSVCLDSVRIKSGKTDMEVKGKLSNISRTLRSVRSPLKATLTIVADTIDINSIAESFFAGSDFAAKRHLHGSLSDQEDDEAVDARIRGAGDDKSPHKAMIVPSNLDAELKLSASNVLYSDVWFQRLSGTVGVHDGAINLDRLAGYTPIGSIDLTALYSAPSIDSLRFAAGIVIRKLQLNRFLHLMPQVDSLMPLLRDVDGTITADLAMSTELDSLLDLKFHTLEAVMRLEGDTLSLNDTETFRNIAKWLMFKQKDRFVINHMDVALMVRDSRLDLFPFVFDFDRYRLGVSGSNDMKLNLDYHIAVLKSPLPFRFGVNIKGRPGHLRFSLGKAHFNEYKAYSQRDLTDTTRINLIREIEHVFRFGISEGRRNLHLDRMQKPDTSEFAVPDTLSPADSLLFMEAGVLPPASFSSDSTKVRP